jgi:cytochrome c peroxidase
MTIRVNLALSAAAVLIGAALSSTSTAQTAAVTTRASLAALIEGYRRPVEIPSPAHNPTTAAKVELGKMLFFDPRLSGSGAISCGTCHNPSLGWQDGLATGVGHNGAKLARRTPTILNTAWSEPLMWDGRFATLEDQAKGPLEAEVEMNMPHDEVVSRVASIPGYVEAFEAAYPGEPIDINSVAKAIAAYERTIVSAVAPFDRWVEGEDSALSEPAKRGFVLFNGKANCSGCHVGWRMTDDGFHDVGLPSQDVGRGAIMPGLQILEHAFKTPTLRNIAERAPYMHDGSIATLEDVVEHYDSGFVRRPSLSPQMKPLKLTAQERADLVEFMRSLSSRDDPVTLPTLPR